MQWFIEERGKVQCECRKCFHEVVHEIGGNCFPCDFPMFPQLFLCVYLHTQRDFAASENSFRFHPMAIVRIYLKIFFFGGETGRTGLKKDTRFYWGKGGFWGIFFFIVGSFFMYGKIGLFQGSEKLYFLIEFQYSNINSFHLIEIKRLKNPIKAENHPESEISLKTKKNVFANFQKQLHDYEKKYIERNFASTP